MAFHNPLHSLSLNDGARALTIAMADWAILTVDPSGILLPAWKYDRLRADVVATHQFRRQDSQQQLDCFHQTAFWCSFLWSMAQTTELLFHPNRLRELPILLDRVSRGVQHRMHYPYQHSIAWHHPADHRLLMQSGWLAEIMLNLPQPDAMNFLEALIVDWLRIHPFAGLPNNGGQLKTIDRRRGYVLWMMAMDFEQCALPASNNHGRLAESYRAPNSESWLQSRHV